MNTSKMSYESPDMAVCVLDIEDCITVSGGSGGIELPDDIWFLDV